MNKIKQTKLSISIVIYLAFLLIIAACAAIIFNTDAQADSQNYGEHVPGEVIACVETDPYFGDPDNSNSALNQINDQMNSFLSSYNCETLLCFTGNDAIYNTVANDSSIIAVHDNSDSYTKPAQTRYVKIKFDKNQKSMSQMIKELESLSVVKYAEPNYVAKSSAETPDFSDSQYAYDTEGPTGSTHNKAGMNVSGWNNSSTPNIASSDKAVVAVLDSGVDYNHPDIKSADKVYGNLQTLTGIGGEHGYNAGANTSIGESDKDPMDNDIKQHGHGTHVAGIIAAQWNNFGVSGGAYDCSILPVRVSSSTANYMSDGIIRAYGYVCKAKESGINVVAANNSWAGTVISSYLPDLVTKAGEKGIISVFGTANDNKNTDAEPYTVSSLQNNPYVISVNSSNELGYKSAFSNYGKNTTDVFAPGQNIYSTVPSWEGTQSQNLMASDIRYLSDGQYNIMDDFENEYSNWSFNYYTDEECTKRITTAESGQGYSKTGSPGNALKISDISPDNNRIIYITGDYNKIANNKKLTLMFKEKAQFQNTDNGQLAIYDYYGNKDEFLYGISFSSASLDESYFPISVPVSMINNKDGQFKIGLKFWYFDSSNELYPTDYYIDKVSVTDTEYAYNYNSGTSMASPACCGIAAALAAKYPNEPTEKIVARIKGGTNQKSWFKDLCYSGGIVDLGRASSDESSLDPVVISANLVSSSTTSSVVKISGYFLGDNSSAVTINGLPASSVVAGTEGNRQTLTCTFGSSLSGAISINVNKNGKSLTRNLDIGNNNDVLERINMPDRDTYPDYYSSVANNLVYASDNYLISNTYQYYTALSSTYIYNFDTSQWRSFKYHEDIKNAFADKGITTANIAYICASENRIVYTGITIDGGAYKCVGFAYYDISSGSITVDVIQDDIHIPAFGFIDGDFMYLGCQDLVQKKNSIISYNLITKEFVKLADGVSWGVCPVSYKLEDGKFLLIDNGNVFPLPSTISNDMYILSIDDKQNGDSATITKIEDQDAFPTSVSANQNKMTGHAVINGKLMMTGPCIVNETNQGVVADTFLRNIETKEEITLPSILSNCKVYQPSSINNNDYVFTYFVDSQGPAIAKRYVGSPVPPTPDPTPTPIPQAESFEPVSTAATGDNTLPAVFAIIAVVITGGFAIKNLKIE